MKNLDPETIEKKTDESIKTTDPQELSDEMLDGVSGGLVQLVNPSSARP